MSRLNLIAPAVRPKLSARALFQGPQGSGKTWTMLSVARHLTAETDGRIVGIDTERESMLTYADVFDFEHLPWRAPFDPTELTQTLDQFDRQCSPDDVVIVDSFSHFWFGTGGILDIAGGRVQGGWDRARPIQQRLIEQIIAMRCHILLGVRMKNTVQVLDGGKTIENIGLTITQDQDLGYELNVVLQMDQQHAISVMKSRTPAVPVGRVYPGGYESKLAEDYERWLAGGIPPANRDDVDRIMSVFSGITDREKRAEIKAKFVQEFGMPQSLTAEQVPAVHAWLDAQGHPINAGDEPDPETEAEPEAEPLPPADPDEFREETLSAPESDAAEPEGESPPEAAEEPTATQEPVLDRQGRPLPSLDRIETMNKPDAQRWLRLFEQDPEGLADEVRARLYAFVVAEIAAAEEERDRAEQEQDQLAAESDAQAAAEAEAYAQHQADSHPHG